MQVRKISNSDGLYGLFDDDTHQIILPCEYVNIEELQYNNLVVVHKETERYHGAQWVDGKYRRAGLFNAKTRRFIIPCQCHSIWHFDKNTDLACVIKENDGHSSGYINALGEVKIPFIYDMPWHDNFDSNNAITLRLNDKYGVVDYMNRTRLPFRYENLDAGRFEYIEQPLSRICENGLWGFVNREYQIVISCRYSNALEYFPVGEYWRTLTTDTNGKDHLLDERGRDIIPSKYSYFRLYKDREYFAECYYKTLFGGWIKEYVSTLDGHILGSNSSDMDQKTKDVLAYAIIYGSVSVAKAALNLVCNALGCPPPSAPLEGYYSKQARDRAWDEYKHSGSIINALGKMF